jgi:hypothetical protein
MLTGQLYSRQPLKFTMVRSRDFLGFPMKEIREGLLGSFMKDMIKESV